jgi:ribosomal protein L21E
MLLQELPVWSVPEPFNKRNASNKPRRSTDHYTNFEPIYNGAISTVYHATCRNTGREVVLKAYHKEVMDERHHLRLERELRVQRAIQDKAAPHVCELLDAFEEGDDIFLVLERCVGGDVFAMQHEVGGSLNESYACTVRTPCPLVQVDMHQCPPRTYHVPSKDPCKTHVCNLPKELKSH